MGSRFTTHRSLLAAAMGLGLAFGAYAAEAPDIGSLPALEIDEAKAALGKRLFFDQRLSGDAGIACSDCHSSEAGYGSKEALTPGYPGNGHFRNAPTLINTAHKKGLGHPWNWDGRIGTNLNAYKKEFRSMSFAPRNIV